MLQHNKPSYIFYYRNHGDTVSFQLFLTTSSLLCQTDLAQFIFPIFFEYSSFIPKLSSGFVKIEIIKKLETLRVHSFCNLQLSVINVNFDFFKAKYQFMGRHPSMTHTFITLRISPQKNYQTVIRRDIVCTFEIILSIEYKNCHFGPS